MTLIHQIGWAIRQRRKTLGLSLEAVALKANVCVGYLSHIERAKNNAGVLILERICAALDVHITYLFSAATREAWQAHQETATAMERASELNRQ